MISWKLILSHSYVALVAAAVAGLVTWRTLDIHHQRDIGVWQERVRVQDSLATVQSHQIDSLKAAFHTDTVRLARTLVRYDSIRDTLQMVLHDTTAIRDTLVRVVERYRDQTDSTISTCVLALDRCTALSAHQDTLVRSYRVALRASAAARPGFLGRTVSVAKWLGVGLAAGYVYAKH